MGIKNTIGSKGFISEAINGTSETIFEPGFFSQINGTIWVDKNSTSSSEDGSYGSPFKTIQAAIDVATESLPSGAPDSYTTTIMIASGQYDEDLTIEFNGTFNPRIIFVALGSVSLGLFTHNTFVGTKRNISITGTPVTVSSNPNGNITFTTFVIPNAASSLDYSLVPGFRISGQIDASAINFTPFNMFLNLRCVHLNAEGTVTNPAITGTVGGIIFLSLDGCNIEGTIAGSPDMDAVHASNTEFNGNISLSQFHYANSCVFKADVSVSAVGTTTFSGAGFVDCIFDAGTTFTGPSGSFLLNGYTNYFVNTNSVTLSGSATKVLLHSEV